MKRNKFGISISDFQPYHDAYYKLHLKILLECGFLYIYVINPDDNNPKYNPFTSKEVSKMIKNSFSEEQKKLIKIIFVRKEEEIKINLKNKKVRYYYFDNSNYLLKHIDCEKIKINWNKENLTGKEILDGVYSKKQEVFNQVSETNIKYLRRLIIPF